MPKVKKKKSANPIPLIAGVVIVIVIAVLFFLYKKADSQKTVFDEYPIWLLQEGKVAVYREMEVSPAGVRKTVSVAKLDNSETKRVQVYEAIPKEIAQSASDLRFSTQPQIIEDDPLVLWDIDPNDSSQDSWWDTVTFLPKLAYGVTSIVGKTAVGKLSGACGTQTAQEWMEKNKFGTQVNAMDCYSYLEHIDKEIQYRESEEWQNKLEENAVYKSLEPGTDEYEEVKSKVKGTEEKQTSTSKITKEEAINAVKQNHPEPLKAVPDAGWPASVCNPDDTEYVASEKKWRVICKRGQFEIGDIAHAAVCEIRYDFFTVDNNGQTEKVGWYSKCKYKKDGSDLIHGEPKWGVK